MPDTEKSFVNLSGTPEYRKAAPAPLESFSQLPNLSRGQKDDYNPLDDTSLSYKSPKKTGYEASTVTMAEAAPYRTGRYDSVAYGYDNEEAAGQRQSLLDKAANGILKGTNLIATTIAGGFGMLYGAAKSPFSGRLADIWDNPALRALDEWNEEVDNKILPNYYTKAEKDAAWYSTDNWLTANFLFDKLIKNSGFAVGAMLSGNLVNASLLRAGSSVARLAAAGATASEASQAFKLFSPLLKNTARAFSSGKNIEVAAELEKGISSIADITARSSELAKIARTTGKFAEFGDGFRRTAVALYSSAGESVFEALQTGKEFRNNLIQEYQSKYGEAPSGKDLEDINQKSEQVGKMSFFGNLALLGATEYAQLPYLLGSSYKNSRRALGTFSTKTDDILLREGKYVADVPISKFGKAYDKFKRVGGYVYDPKESFQELGQYAIQIGTQNYFKKAALSDDASVWTDGFLYGFFGRDEQGEGKGALVSKEGMESALLGGLTGGAMQAIGTRGEKKALTENTAKFLNVLNATPSFKQAFVDKMQAVNRGVVLQQQHESAIITGNELEARDIRTDMMHNYLAPRIKYGRFDMVMDDIAEMKITASTEDGLSNLKAQGIGNINDTIESFNKRISAFETVAKNTNEIYNGLYIRFASDVNEKGEPKYSPLVIDKMAYAASKITDYDLRIPKLNSQLIDSGIIVGDILDNVLKGKQPSRQSTAQALNEINSLPVLSITKDGLKTALQDIIELGQRRKTFMEEYEDIKENPLKYESFDEYRFGESSELPVTVKQTLPREKGKKAKKVDREIEIGQEYSLVEPIKKEGSSLYLAPKVTVLSQTLGGELEVMTPSGKIKFIAPEDIAQYNLSEEDNASDELNKIVDEVIDEVLTKSKYRALPQIEKNELKIDYINSLDNESLIKDVEKGVKERYSKFYEEKTRQDNILKKESVKKALEETSDTGEITRDIDSGNFEPDPKKTKEQIPNSTKPPVEGYSQDENTTPLAEHHLRANRFGSRFYSFSNVNNFRGVIVTQENETKVGLPGLMQWLKDEGTDPDVDPSQTIVLVVKGVDPVTGETYFVGENGEKLDTPSLQTAIYQTFPISLTWSGGGSMFRNEDLGQSEAITKEYNNWRTSTLKNPSENLYKILASFGTPQYVKELNDQGRLVNDNLARISVEDSGLISEGRLSTHRVIGVPTTDGAFLYGSSTFNNVKGVPLLFSNGGAVRLRNKTFSKKEAELIYTVIEKLSTNLLNDGNLRSGESVFLYNWLKSVIYWGTPETITGERKKAASSSVFFENGFLLMGKEETKFSIKPVDLAANKDEIVKLLQNMYGNVNSTLVTGGNKGEWNKSYTEIIAITDQGIQTREWKNYQTFLLSSKNPDGSNRNPESIPLTTRIRPITDKQDTNRKGIYFTVIDKNSTVSEKPVKPVATPPPTTPPTASSSEGKSSKKFDLKNKDAENIIESKIGKFPFVIDIDKFNESGGLEGINLPDPASDIEYSNSLEKALVKLSAFPSMGLTEDMSNEEAFPIIENVIRNLISKAVKAQIEEEKPSSSTPTAPAPVVTPAPTAPVSDAIADIERKIQDFIEIKDWTKEKIALGRDIAKQIIIEDKTLRDFKESFNLNDFEITGKFDRNYTGLQEYINDAKSEFVSRLVSEGILKVIPAIIKEQYNTSLYEKVFGRIWTGFLPGEQQYVTKDNVVLGKSSEVVTLFKKYIAARDGKTDAELAALEGAKPINDGNSASEDLRNRVDRAKRDGVNKRGRAFSLMLENESGKMSPEEWAKTEAWIKENFPNIPVYRVKNYILASGGRKAHGMFENGAIYLSENSQVGTIYHEVFHAVWQSLTSAEERTSIEKEFKQRKGTFLDRKTMKDVSYSEATYKQMEEKLAEEFRDHIQENKVVNEPKSWIGKLFRDIINFFKTFFTGKDSRINTEKLFNKIGTGYYAGSNAYETELSFAKKGLIDVESVTGGELADYELSDVFTGEQLHDIMQHMTYATVADLITEDKGLFTINKIPKSELYVNLADELADIIAEDVAANEETFSKEVADAKNKPLISLYEKLLYNWEDIIDKHQEYLNSYGIEFDENDDLELSDSEKSKEDPYGDARKIDNMRKANAAIKLLFASIPIVDSTGKEVLSKSFGGYTLYPMSELFMGVMNRTHTSRSVDEMLNRIKQMGEDDPKYVKLYKALLKSKDISDVDSESGLQLLSALWRSFKKQSPAVKTVYILEDGTIQVGDANFTVAARQVADEFLNGIKKAIADGTKYFVKSADSKSYIGNKEAINKNIKEDNLEKQVNFLREINIDFDIDKLKTSKYLTMFSIAVNGIRTSIAAGNSVVSIGGRTLSITGRLRELAEVKAILDNPEFNSTYYNVNGELTQTFIGTNPASDLYNALSQVNNISELAGTQYAYLLTDSFARNSTILWRIFDKKSGDRIENSENLMEVGYADGTVNQELGKQIESSKLNFKQRFLQEINLNLQGYYLNLVPGDAKIEWMMYMGNLFSKNDILLNYNKVFDVFKGYLDDEIQLTNEPNRILAKNRDGNTLRFFSSILEEDKELQKEILEFEGTIDVLYEAKDEQGVVYGERINNAVLNFINRETGKLRATLVESGSLKESEGKFTTDGLAFGQTEMTEEELNNQLFLLSVNYAVNNIELHKVLYSDPYFYSDELKRIKNFSSPRQAIVNNSLEMNSAYHKVWNKGLKTDDDAYTNFEREYFRAITLKDVLSINNLYKGESPWEETDGGGMITLKALRQFKIRAGEWDTDQERQYKYDMVWKKNHDGKIKLTKSEKRILKEGNPGIKRTYTPIKPIVAGNKASGRPWNDVILDKFSLYPLSYRVAYEVNKDANALKLYDKMMKEDVDYAVFKSGRKVGAEKEFPLYNDKGEFNTELFETEEQKVDIFTPQTVIDVPFAIMSIQSEVPSKDSDEITRGTQMTKLATLDFLQGGVPVDFMSKELDYNERYKAFFNMTEDEKLSYTTPYKGDNLYKRIKENQNILEALVEEGVEQLMEEFGIDRILGENDKTIGFEIKDVTKLADTLKREITKRDVNYNISKSLQGFRNGDVVIEATPMYQQVRNIIYSIADRNVMSPKTKGSTKVQIPSTLFESGIRPVKDGLYSSDVLKFYVNEDGKRVCEVMIAKWFDDNGETDEALIERLNASPELSEMLRGVAFRIPSQKQNSIDVFKIAKFLPKEFGDSVVVPSALVKKSGSDFDIDKLNMYLKHIDVDKNTGEIRLLPFHGIGPTSKAKFRYKSDYKKSLENGYIKSLEGLVSHPLNFNSLTKPNSADPMKNLSREITGKLGFSTFDYNKPGNMLQRRFMSRLRNALVVGKYAIGIAAVNQTNHSLMQRAPMYIDRRKIDGQDSSTKEFLGDGEIKFNKYNTIEVDGELYPSLSMVSNAEGKSISDVLSQLIDGYVDISKDTWIIELGITPNVASTWMFLIRIGVPVKTVAYFMNQPLIREYLKELENKGSTWLWDDTLLKSVERRYKGSANITVKTMPNDQRLEYMVGKSLKDVPGKQTLSAAEIKEQKFMLREFLKYAKMGEQLFIVSQGTNFDTSSFNDPFLVFKKLEQLERARKTIISSKGTNKGVDAILDASFLGKMKDGIIESREIISEVLLSDKPGRIRDAMEHILKPYIRMNDRDFIRTSQRAVATLFDWVTQTKSSPKPLNSEIERILIDKKTNVATRVMDFIKEVRTKEDHPLRNNHIIKIISADFSDPGKNEPNNLKIKNKNNKTYDQNQIIFAFKELKNYLASENNKELYDDLVTLSVLQSGINQSSISFTSLLPYEDFLNVYNEVLSDLPVSDIEAFTKLDVFQRTFWTYDDVVPHMKAKYRYDFFGQMPTYNDNMAFPVTIYNAINEGDIPKLLKINETSKEANYDVIVYTWETSFPSKIKREMRNRGDYSYINKGLFKRVGYLNGQYIYKAINAWGDGMYSREFYDIPRKSVVQNGFIEVNENITDAKIMSYFTGMTEKPKEQEAAKMMTVEPTIPSSQPQPSQRSVADIPQNKVSGVESYGSLVTANAEVIKALGPNPHSIDMIEAGFRTRTTRSEKEMAKYAIKVGDVVKHFGKSADGTTKNIYARVTAIHPKGTPGWEGTWKKEGWKAEDVNVIDRFKDGAAAIEFELINNPPSETELDIDLIADSDFKEFLEYETDILSYETLNEAIQTEEDLYTYLDEFETSSAIIDRVNKFVKEGNNKEAFELMSAIPEVVRLDEMKKPYEINNSTILSEVMGMEEPENIRNFAEEKVRSIKYIADELRRATLLIKDIKGIISSVTNEVFTSALAKFAKKHDFTNGRAMSEILESYKNDPAATIDMIKEIYENC